MSLPDFECEFRVEDHGNECYMKPDSCENYLSRWGATDEEKCWVMPECDFDHPSRKCYRKPTDVHVGVEKPREDWCPAEFEWNGWAA